MDETLWNGVDKKFEKVLGKVSSAAKCLSELRKYDRYVNVRRNRWRERLRMPSRLLAANADPGEPARVGVELNSNPKSAIRRTVVTAFRNFAKKNAGWKDAGLDDEKEWASITRGAYLKTFMSESDHLKANRDYFSALLDEVMQFRSVNPKLPWSTRSPDAEDA